MMTARFGWLVAALACSLCRAGAYSTGQGISDVRSLCQAGTYSTGQGMISSETCSLCQAGAYSTGEGMISNETCSLCQAGAYSTGEGMISDETCSLCQAGAYSTGQGMIGNEACGLCQAGTYSTGQGMTSSEKCSLCQAGSISISEGVVSSAACTLCKIGTFETANRTRCQGCGAGKYGAAMVSTSEEACMECPPGTEAYGADAVGCWLKSGYFSSISSVRVPGEPYMSSDVSTIAGATFYANASTFLEENHPSRAFSNVLSNWKQLNIWKSASYTYFGSKTPGEGAYATNPSRFWNGNVNEYKGNEKSTTFTKLVFGKEVLMTDLVQYGEWIQIHVPVPMALSAFQIRTGGALGESGTPNEFSIFGSMDGVRWIELAYSWQYNPLYLETRSILVKPRLYMVYTYFRLSVIGIATSADREVVIDEWALFPYFVQACKPGERLQRTIEQSPMDIQECRPCFPGEYTDTEGSANCKPCSSCSQTIVSCTPQSDAVCAVPCEDPPTEQPGYDEWMSEDYKCKQGQYLHALGPGGTKDCRQCPAELVGLNRVYCERCGELEEAYFLDQSLCVCTAPARMNRTGWCVCPDGLYNLNGKCVECGNNTYGAGGACFQCGAGNYSSGGGATACQACPTGKYRRREDAECRGCWQGKGWYSTDAMREACVPCNLSCAGVEGIQEQGVCPGDANGGYKVCVACDKRLPSGASWSPPHGNCLYTCNAGFYMKPGSGSCVKCSTEACAAGYMWRECTADADRSCEEACTNASKPYFNSKWAASGSSRACPWECESGYSAVVSDYVMFQIHECVPQSRR